MKNTIKKNIISLINELSEMDIEDRINIINEIKKELHSVSPFSKEPVDCVLWVKQDKIKANDYNPNTVAPPEMKLLERSIEADGYTQPIVSWLTKDGFEVIDGYHRNRVGKELGMDQDEVLRLTQITGLAEMFKDREFSLAWEAEKLDESDYVKDHEAID